MSALRIQLSGAELTRLKKRAQALGFEDAESYARSLVADALNESFDAPAHLKIRSKKDLEAKLVEGVRSGRTRAFTESDWANLKADARRRIAARSVSKAS